MGTVEPGKNADLVLLRTDPWADVANLHDIAGVIRAGRYYSAAAVSATIERIAETHAAV